MVFLFRISRVYFKTYSIYGDADSGLSQICGFISWKNNFMKTLLPQL